VYHNYLRDIHDAAISDVTPLCAMKLAIAIISRRARRIRRAASIPILVFEVKLR
jgi:hypothetical protein